MATGRRTAGGIKSSMSRPRGILRVPEVLIACASRPQGLLATLCKELRLPKTSLYRMLRTLENGGYLTHEAGHYALGPASFHMASLIGQQQRSTSFPASARPVIEWLARETSESVMLGVLSDERTMIIYVSGVNSTEPLRYTLPLGARRPLFSGASGKTVLAFMPDDERETYLANMEFFQMTPSSPAREDMPALLVQVRRDGVFHERNGSFEGASALASPIFDNEGKSMAAVSLAGPTERLDANLERFIALTKSAAERVSRGLGYMASTAGLDGIRAAERMQPRLLRPSAKEQEKRAANQRRASCRDQERLKAAVRLRQGKAEQHSADGPGDRKRAHQQAEYRTVDGPAEIAHDQIGAESPSAPVAKPRMATAKPAASSELTPRPA